MQTHYIKEVCELCNATVAYTVSSQHVDYLEGYYKETLQQILNVTSDMNQYLPNSTYAIAVDSNSTCVAGYKFEGVIDYSLVYLHFAEADEEAIQPPEIFTLEDNTFLEYLAIRHNSTSYDYFSLDYSTSQTAEVSFTTTLNLKQLYVYFENNRGFIHYKGDSSIDNGIKSAQLMFLIETDYTRKYGQSFIVTQMVDNQFYIYDWLSLVDPDNKCSSLEAPGGLYSFNNFTVQVANEVFTWSTTYKVMKLNYILSYFTTPSYAVYQDIRVDSSSGSIRVNSRDKTCDYTLSGDWFYSNFTLKLEISNKDYTPYKVLASISGQDKISMQEIDEYFYSFFFPEAGEMLPTVAPESSEFYKKLSETVIKNPKILLYFHEDVSFEISGDVDSEYTIWAGVIAARTSDGIANVGISIESVGSYMEAENVTNTGLTFSESIVTAASDDIEIIAEPVMRPAWDQDKTEWKLGVYAYITLTFNDDCRDRDFCLIIQNYASFDDSKRELELEGSIVGDNLGINYPIDSIKIGQGFTFKETALTIEQTEQGQTLEIVGTIYIRGDSKTVLRFVGRIFSGENGEAYLETENEDMWRQAFDLQELNVAGLEFLAQLDGDAQIINSNSTAAGMIGPDCYTGTNSTLDSCLLGSIEISFNGMDYKHNSFNFTSEEVSGVSFFNYLGGYSFSSVTNMPLAVQGLNFTYLSIYHQYSSRNSFLLYGFGYYQGILATLSGYFNSLSHANFNIQGSLDSFIFGEGNIKLENVTSGMQSDYESMQFEGYLQGNCTAFGIQTLANISITDRYHFSIQGKPFKGVFDAELEFIGVPNPHISGSGFSVRTVLNKNILSYLEKIIRGNLYLWKDSGLSTMLTSYSIVFNLTADLSAIEALVCDPEVACPTHLTCDTLNYNTCTNRPLHLICASDKNKCEGVKLNCTSYSKICVKKECDECDCMSEVEVCEEWASACISEQNDVCREQQIEINSESCIESISECHQERVREPSCELKCSSYKRLYNEAKEEYLVYSQAHQQNLQDMKGFLEMNELTQLDPELSKLVSLSKIYSVRELDSSGLGPGDFKFSVSGLVLDIEQASMQEFSDMFRLNFYYLHETEKILLEIIKSEIISHSDNMLSEDLAVKNPIEISEENLDYNGEVSSTSLVELSSFLTKEKETVVSSDISDIMELFYKV